MYVHTFGGACVPLILFFCIILYTLFVLTTNDDFWYIILSKMNGAELPCGSILRVEAADSNYKASATAPSIKDKVSSTNSNNDAATDDLDDFFDSL